MLCFSPIRCEIQLFQLYILSLISGKILEKRNERVVSVLEKRNKPSLYALEKQKKMVVYSIEKRTNMTKFALPE